MATIQVTPPNPEAIAPDAIEYAKYLGSPTGEIGPYADTTSRIGHEAALRNASTGQSQAYLDNLHQAWIQQERLTGAENVSAERVAAARGIGPAAKAGAGAALAQMLTERSPITGSLGDTQATGNYLANVDTGTANLNASKADANKAYELNEMGQAGYTVPDATSLFAKPGDPTPNIVQGGYLTPQVAVNQQNADTNARREQDYARYLTDKINQGGPGKLSVIFNPSTGEYVVNGKGTPEQIVQAKAKLEKLLGNPTGGPRPLNVPQGRVVPMGNGGLGWEFDPSAVAPPGQFGAARAPAPNLPPPYGGSGQDESGGDNE